MDKKKHNSSLFFYTGLIFVVAVLLIVITFFGQSRFEKTQPVPVDTQTEMNGITQKAAVLSDENKALLEKNQELQQKIEEQNGTIDGLNQYTAVLENRAQTSELLFSANGYVSKKMYKQAREILEKIDEQTLSEDETILYQSLMKKVK